MFHRKIVADLEEVLTAFPVVGIVGPRQVGKTTLAKELAKQINKKTVYLDLENPRDLAKLNDPVFFFEAHEDMCVILDEIQVRRDLFPIMRAMVDKNRVAARFIILGSASPDLIHNSAESLAGRIYYEQLTPLLWDEVKDKVTMTQLWVRGGFPDSLLPQSISISRKWRMSFLQTYLERDLLKLGLNTSSLNLSRLWQMLCHFHAQILGYETISRSIGMTGPTIKRYIEFLKDAYLVRLLPSYHVNTKKRLVKSPKLYIRDTGLLHDKQHIDTYEELISNPINGASWEGFVIEQIASTLGELDYSFFYYRTHQGAEIDLLICKGIKPMIAVEVKFSSSPKVSQGMITSMEDLKLKKGYVITPDSDTYKHSSQITICSLETFIAKFLP